MAFTTAPVTTVTGSGESSYRFALTSLTTLFFMWGFITCLNDILIPHLKAVFDLSYTQAMLVQFCFFGAYFVVSLPAGALVNRIGYQKGIVTGLLTAALGCACFYPAAGMHSYPIFLGALFILASGITVLQVSANPYVTLLGPVETAESRLTMTQAFNSLGTTVAPYLGALFILNEAAESVGAAKSAESVQFPYLLLMAMLLVLAAVFAYLKLPKMGAIEKTSETREQEAPAKAWHYPHLLLGAISIFLYVGAEVSIGSFVVSFLGEESVLGLEEKHAAMYLSYYWGGAMVGRFIGAVIMQRIPGGILLGFNSVASVCLLVIAISTSGQLAMWAILAVGLFNSIMFPTIFSLALKSLGKATSQGSGILCLAIVGGAIVPVIQGVFADLSGVQISFAVPVLCYLFIAYFGFVGSKPKTIKKFSAAGH
ncbi:MAG: sugar MFS transporter [Gammaproteobacteria bacterium]|nr:sugar MFS transporter [Gammaproteobacteria bacterium]